MTAETGMFRKLYGEASKGRMVSTFFGAGNLDLVEVFFDPTGLRRFFQHEIRQDLFRHLEDLFAQVDPLDLWKSVDENGPCPLENPKIVDLLIRTESAKRTMTPVEEWIKSVMDGGGWQQHRGTADMFEMFTTWRDRFFPHDKSNLSSFQTQLGRVLRDGDYPHDKKLDPVTRRAIYRLGEPPVETPEFIDTRNSIVVAIDKARARADARRGSNLENITKTA